MRSVLLIIAAISMFATANAEVTASAGNGFVTINETVIEASPDVV